MYPYSIPKSHAVVSRKRCECESFQGASTVVDPTKSEKAKRNNDAFSFCSQYTAYDRFDGHYRRFSGGSCYSSKVIDQQITALCFFPGFTWQWVWLPVPLKPCIHVSSFDDIINVMNATNDPQFIQFCSFRIEKPAASSLHITSRDTIGCALKQMCILYGAGNHTTVSGSHNAHLVLSDFVLSGAKEHMIRFEILRRLRQITRPWNMRFVATSFMMQMRRHKKAAPCSLQKVYLLKSWLHAFNEIRKHRAVPFSMQERC